uniref:Uncharacterized protein n=1 Tax=Anguilla anguilla TaxID=7936 RepID=A0A0E9S747_ANGAN
MQLTPSIWLLLPPACKFGRYFNSAVFMSGLPLILVSCSWGHCFLQSLLLHHYPRFKIM